MLGSEYSQNKKSINATSDFLRIVENLFDRENSYRSFSFGNIKRLEINGKYIYLWQNVKGDVNYSFTLFDKDYHTTSPLKLGNILSNYFECQIEVVNNEKEHLNKITKATNNLNKALANNAQHEHYSNYYNGNELNSFETNNKREEDSPRYEITSYTRKEYSLHNQERLYKNIVELSTYDLESHLDTIFIRINEIPIVHKEVFIPYRRRMFFLDEKGLNCKNSFIPTEYMAEPVHQYPIFNSFILEFIFFMARKNVSNALKILEWTIDCFLLGDKIPYALVLHSTDDKFMKLFYDEIITALLGIDNCEKIENIHLDKKSLSNKLDKKVIYNFHNITTPTVMDEPVRDLTNRLIHKDSYKLNKKNITTCANILITSTTKYIPLTSKDVPSVKINISSTITELANKYNIQTNHYYEIEKMIKNDIDNFVDILKSINLRTLYSKNDSNNHSLNNESMNILDGNVEPIEVFDRIIRDKDIVPFEYALTNVKSRNLVQRLKYDFSKNQIVKNNLLDYFELLFGTNIYKSNRNLISDLRKYFSNTSEPFDEDKTRVRNGLAYYFL